MTTRLIGPEPFRGWRRTWRLANDVVECRVVADVGPRVVELRRVGGASLLHFRAAEAGGSGERRWRFRGGWRCWVAPEERATTYARDNEACRVEVVGRRTLRVVGPPQRAAGIRKVVSLAIDRRRPRIAVESRIVNVGRKPVTYAPWTLAVLRPGGRAFVPLGRGAPAALARYLRAVAAPQRALA